MVERVKSGIPGMDEILNGGIPKRNAVLVAGGPGTGKTIMSQQFLIVGAVKYGEPGIYVTLEEHPAQVRRDMSSFDWYDVGRVDVRKLEEEGKIAIVDAFTAGIGRYAEREKYVVTDPTDVTLLSDVIREAIKDIGAQRAVIDSVSTLYLTKPSVARNIVLQLKKVLAGLGVTAILVSQVSASERGFGGPGVEHAADGIIRLDLDEIKGELKRSLIVWKMRGTSHSLRRHPFEITDKGVIIYPDKVVEW
ncbi:MAG: KaiC domain-containing protein [bacterium]|nr:KaiC domain-containing protein [bacterium]